MEAEHGEAHAEDLSGTEMSVGLFGVAKICVEGFHGKAVSYQPSAFSLALHVTSRLSLIVGKGSGNLVRPGSFSPPADTVFGDFDEDASIGEFIADCIRLFEIAGSAGRLHFGYPGFDVPITELASLHGSA